MSLFLLFLTVCLASPVYLWGRHFLIPSKRQKSIALTVLPCYAPMYLPYQLLELPAAPPWAPFSQAGLDGNGEHPRLLHSVY
jgi:hypothetical protein